MSNRHTKNEAIKKRSSHFGDKPLYFKESSNLTDWDKFGATNDEQDDSTTLNLNNWINLLLLQMSLHLQKWGS